MAHMLKQIVTLLNVPHSMEKWYLPLNSLVSVLQGDPDLLSLQRNINAHILQALCSFALAVTIISYFKTLEKATINNTLN